MKANTIQTSTVRPIRSTDNSDGICRIVASPRCTALFSDGNHCKLACCVLDKSVHGKDRQYTKHCYRHGGKQELSAYQREQAQSIMTSTVQAQTSTIQNMLDLVPSHDSASKDSQGPEQTSLHQTTNPKGTVGMVPDDSTSIGLPISPTQGGPSEKSLLKLGGSVPQSMPGQLSGPTEQKESLYSTGDPTLRKSFQHKLNKGEMNLNEELAMVRTLIQDIFKRMQAGTNAADELRQLTKLLPLADKILNTIHRIEDTRKVQYTRESLRMDVMKVVAVIRRIVPEEPRRREFATELAKILGPAMAESGDIIVSREVFKKG